MKTAPYFVVTLVALGAVFIGVWASADVLLQPTGLTITGDIQTLPDCLNYSGTSPNFAIDIIFNGGSVHGGISGSESCGETYNIPTGIIGVQVDGVYTVDIYNFNGSILRYHYQVQKSGSGWFLVSSVIDWNQIYFPLPYAASTTAIAASSSLWSAFASSSALVATCNSGNLFSDGICQAVSFLFIPNPNTLQGFFALPTLAATKFPFSWIYGVQVEFQSLAVSSTTAMTTLSYNFHDLGIGSTTPMGNILPNIQVFSKSTIETYISPTLWAAFQTLIASAMWLSFVWYEFNRARHMSKPHAV